MFVGNVKGAAITATYLCNELTSFTRNFGDKLPQAQLICFTFFVLFGRLLYALRNYYESSFFELSAKFKFMANHLFTLRQLISCKREISPRSIVENVLNIVTMHSNTRNAKSV